MSGPLKTKMIMGLKRLEKLDLSFQVQIDQGKTALENALILEANLAAIQAELQEGINSFSEMETALSLWGSFAKVDA